MKMSYRISFIEDDEGVKNDIIACLEDDFEIVDIPLYEGDVPIYSDLDDLKDLVKNIFNSRLDAIIIDYSLRDKSYDIKFDGAELVEEIKDMMPEFPIFVLSAREKDAESYFSDVNLVYIKEEYLDSPDKLRRRIKQQIGNYREKISNAEKRLKELLKKQEDEELTLNEEEEIIKLDDFLESTQLRSTKVPLSLKKTTDIEKLNKLIIDTEKLIKEIEEKSKDA